MPRNTCCRKKETFPSKHCENENGAMIWLVFPITTRLGSNCIIFSESYRGDKRTSSQVSRALVMEFVPWKLLGMHSKIWRSKRHLRFWKSNSGIPSSVLKWTLAFHGCLHRTLTEVWRKDFLWKEKFISIGSNVFDRKRFVKRFLYESQRDSRYHVKYVTRA